MKRLMKQFSSIGLTLILLSATHGQGQGTVGDGTFQNLDFEQAVSQGGPGLYPLGSLLPGWSASLGGVPQSSALYNVVPGATAAIVLLGPQSSPPVGPAPPPVINGQFSALLISANSGVAQPPTSASISQTGMVPTGTQSIQIKIKASADIPSAADFTLTLGGVSISMLPLSTTGPYTLFEGNISAFGGLMKQLTITAPAPPVGVDFVALDDITFSSQFVPEPSSLALLALGGGLVAILTLVSRRTRSVPKPMF